MSLKIRLTRAGAKPPAISVSVLDAIPAGGAGKRPLVVALPSPPHSRDA